MSSFGAFNPLLAESEFVHRAAVDCLKWQLGEPVPWPSVYYPDSSWPLYHPAYYYPWTAAVPSGQYHYSAGFRDGLSASRSGRSSGASTPGGVRSEAAAAAAAAAAPPAKAEFPGDLMAFPNAGYRRALCAYPVSTSTSYDDLTLAWPYGCKPFYYRRADPPSVRYC